MRLVDADALKENCDIKLGNDTIGKRQYVMFHEIDEAPTIDAVEVVRCKDCKHYSVKGKTTQFGFCGYRHAGTDETDYCSRAVRRET